MGTTSAKGLLPPWARLAVGLLAVGGVWAAALALAAGPLRGSAGVVVMLGALAVLCVPFAVAAARMSRKPGGHISPRLAARSNVIGCELVGGVFAILSVLGAVTGEWGVTVACAIDAVLILGASLLFSRARTAYLAQERVRRARPPRRRAS